MADPSSDALPDAGQETVQEAPCIDQIVEETFMTYSTFLTVRHIEAGGPGYDRGYTTIEGLYFPYGSQCDIWPYLDLRAHRFTNNEYAANAGVGFRWQPPCHDFMYGFNIYYDYRSHRSRSFHFHQVGVGFEMLNCDWSFQLNGYWPFPEKRRIRKCTFDDYIGDFFIIQNQYTGSFRGADLMLGKNFFSCDICLPVDFYIGAGPYYYRGECDDTWGARFVFEARVCRRWLIGVYASHDDFYRGRVQAQIGYTFPFGGCCGTSCNPEVRTQPVRRNEIIYLDKFCKWKTNF